MLGCGVGVVVGRSGQAWMGAWRWTARREEAAGLVADDWLSNAEIAARVGVSRQALDKWRRCPEFAARVAELVEAVRSSVRAKGIAERVSRVAALTERWRAMLAVIDARAVEHAGVPGGGSGLLVRQVKLVKVYEVGPCGELGSTRRVEAVEEYAVDVGLLRELREAERQVAIEVGEWEEKERHSGTLLVREYVGVDVGGV